MKGSYKFGLTGARCLILCAAAALIGCAIYLTEYAKKKGLYVNLSPYDTMRADPKFMDRVMEEVVKCGTIDRVRLVDTVGAATKLAGISRSAFYKYKDCIFDSENGREVITVMATLRDETGALQSLLAGISAAGASIVTINQSTPENGAALVAVTIRTDTMQMSPEELTEKLSRQRMVVSVRCGYNL